MVDLRTQLVLELAVAIIFLHAGVSKLLKPREITRGIDAFGLLPRNSLPLAAVLLTCCELFIGFAHLTAILLPFAIAVAIALLLLLFGVVSMAIRRHNAIECMCFGSSAGEIIGGRSLARIIALLATEIAVCAGSTASVPFDGRDFVTVATAALVAILSVICFNWLLSASDFIAVLRGCALCAARKDKNTREVTRGAMP